MCYTECTVFHSLPFALVGDAGGLNGLQILGVAVEGENLKGGFTSTHECVVRCVLWGEL